MLPVGLVGLAACLVGSTPVAAGGAGGGSTCLEPAIEPDGALVYWRWIGRLSQDEESCQSESLPSSWNARRLFDAEARLLWPSLDDYCLYEHVGATVPTLDELALIDGLDGTIDHVPAQDLTSSAASVVRRLAVGPSSGRMTTASLLPSKILQSISPDLVAVAPASGSLSTALRPRLEALFDEQAGRLDPLPAANGGGTVRLSLLDTSPDDGSALDPSAHGQTLRLLAERLLCAGTPCLVSIEPSLALAYLHVDPLDRSLSPRVDGEDGAVGLIGELAEATVRDLQGWLEGASPGSRLVLNLSLAWDPLYGGGDPAQSPEQMIAPVAAVYHALEAAACDPRTVSVAAAGNRTDRHPQHAPRKALLPAAWARRTVQCSGMAPRPLVLAVGALDRTGSPLAHAIADDLPEWTAYGDHATVDDSMQTGDAAVLAGSSVAALVVSSTLAAVATYRPDLQMPAVVDAVFWSGDPLGVAADLCAGSSCLDRRRVALCPALHATCAQAQAACPASLPACTPRPMVPPIVFNLPPAPQIEVSNWTVTAPVCSGLCGSTTLHRSPFQSDPPSICPDRQLHGPGRQPTSLPQPQSAMCPTCVYWSTVGSFHAEIDPNAPILGSPTLELQCSNGPVSYALVHPQTGVLSGGSSLALTALPTGCTKALFVYTLAGSTGAVTVAVAEPVLVAQ